jgi:hypothetical protein
MGHQDAGPGPEETNGHSPDLLDRLETSADGLQAPNILQMRIQETLRNPEEANRKNVEHAAKMGIDPDIVMKRWGFNKATLLIIAPLPSSASIGRKATTPADQERVSSPVDIQMEDTTIPSNRGELSLPGDDVQMENACSAEYDGSTPGSDPWTDDTISPTEPGHVDMQRGDNKQVQPKSAYHTTAKSSKSTKEKAKTDLGTMPIKLGAAASKSSSRVADVVSESSGAGAARAAVTARAAPIDTSSIFVNQIKKYPILDLPQWYKDITTSNFKMKEIARKRSLSHTSLESLKNCIGRCEIQLKLAKPVDRRKLEGFFDELRDHVHKSEFLPDINMYLVKAVRILTVENGLPRIFGEETHFPGDIKADAYQLYVRWMRGEFEQDVLRGIITVKGLNRGSDRLNPSYKAKHAKSAKFYGDDGLVLGQCWPSQLCTVRDGAHGSSQGGIFGERGKGTYSIVLSGGGAYHDKDDGDVIVYSGTEGKNYTPTEATQHMITSCSLGNDIRVIRSHQLPLKNLYRPEIGLRYDGLYQIKSQELVNEEKQTHLFTLERVPGQDRIRYGNDAASRPTRFEIAEYKKLKEKI